MIYLAWRNLVDQATVAVQGAEAIAALPKSNLQVRRSEWVWRHTDNGASGITAAFDLAGITEPVQIMAALNTNGRAGSELTKYASYTPGTDSGAVDVELEFSTVPAFTANTHRHIVGVWPGENDTGAYCVHRLVDASAAIPYSETSRFWAGPIWALKGRVTHTVKDTGGVNRSALQYGFPRDGVRYRQLQIDVPAATTDDAWITTTNNFFDAVRRIHEGQELLVVPFVDDPSAAAHTGYLTHKGFVYGKLMSRSDLQTQGGKFMGMRLLVDEIR